MAAPAVAIGAGMQASGGLFSFIGNNVFPLTEPDILGVMDLYVSGLFTEDDAVNIGRNQGLQTNVLDWSTSEYRRTLSITNVGPFVGLRTDEISHPYTWKQAWIQSRIPMPTIHEANEMYRRDLIDEPLYDFYISKQAGSNAGMAKAWQDLRFELGGATDWIRFTVREAFTPQLVSFFGYNKEFPKAITPYLKWLGLDKDLQLPRPQGSTNDDGTPRENPVTLMDLHWWSHWDLPSNTQGYEMSHRLYTDSRYGPSPDVDDETSFNPEHLELLMKANDIPEYWRKRLIKIAYNPLTRVDVRRMYKLGVLTTDAELYHAYRHIGYDDRNAMFLVNFTKTDAQPRIQQKFDVTKNELCEAYSAGFIERITIASHLRLLNYTESDINTYLALCDTRRRTKYNKKILEYIKQNFLRGYTSEDGTRTALVNLNIRTDARDMYLSEWRRIKNIKTRFLSAKEWLDLFENYLVDETETRSRLVNLEFTNLDISRMINLRKRRMTIAINKQLEKQLRARIKAEEKRIKELEKRRKELTSKQEKEATRRQRAIEAQQRKIMSAFTDKNIINFYKNKILTISDIEVILKARGWNTTALVGFIRSYIDDHYGHEHEPEDS